MLQFKRVIRNPMLAFLIGALSATAACHAESSGPPIAPSAVVAASATYDGKDISVSGTVKSPQQRQTKRGTMESYQLCDSGCIEVVQFGSSTLPAEGATQTVSGTFHASWGRRTQRPNVLVVGGGPQ